MSTVLIMTAIFISTFGALWVATLPEKSVIERNAVVFGTSLVGALIVWGLLVGVLQTGIYPTIEVGLAALKWKLTLDPLGLTYAVIASTLWLFAAIYSFGYMSGAQKQRQYFTFFLLSAGITLGIAFSGNLFTLYLFYELLTFSTYPLVVHQGDKEALESGTKYIKYSLVGATLILAALVMLWRLTGGNLDFQTLSQLFPLISTKQTVILFFLFIAGFGVKAAVMPLHGWLPAAMVAPTPVSALLHAVAVVNAGIFGILRTVYSVFGPELLLGLNIRWILLLIASITILMGSLIAIRQDVLKKRLAYSTISQLSYILLGAFMLHPVALAGAILHMIFHSTLKIVLFFAAGIVAEETGYVRISELSGVGRVLPVTMGSFGLVSLGMIGMLPLSGFWSKYYLLRGTLQTDSWMLLVVLLLSGLLNAFYFIPITVKAFTGKTELASVPRSNSLLLMLIPTVVLAALALIFGIWPGLTLPLVDAAVAQFFSL